MGSTTAAMESGSARSIGQVVAPKLLGDGVEPRRRTAREQQGVGGRQRSRRWPLRAPGGPGDHRGRHVVTLPTCNVRSDVASWSRCPTIPASRPTQLAARAAYLLRGNDLGAMTTAAPLLYPHMWSWDAAFVSIGLAPLSVERAVVELDTLLSAQWRNGMIPHIVFANGVDGYFPGPARWATSALAANAPRNRHTSGITQPPVHAIAVQRILDHARTRGRSTRAVAESFLDRRWDDLVRWHRWLAEARDPKSHGRVTLYHGWESGMDNSPRWDSAYANVVPGSVPEYQREDNKIITDATQRPSDVEYDRYLWLLEEMKSARYDDELLPKVMSFAVEDVFVSAILSVACTVLAEIGEDYKRPQCRCPRSVLLGRTLPRGRRRDHRRKNRCGKGLRRPCRPVGRHRDGRAVRAAAVRWPAARQGAGLLRLLEGPRFCGHPDLKYSLIPSTSPVSRDFRPREYWRGPVWPVMTWLFSWCFARRGWAERSLILRREGLRQASDGTFAEYYEPFTGEPLGSMQQSWTAAAVLDWLG